MASPVSAGASVALASRRAAAGRERDHLVAELEFTARPQFLRSDLEMAAFAAMKAVEVQVRRRVDFTDRPNPSRSSCSLTSFSHSFARSRWNSWGVGVRMGGATEVAELLGVSRQRVLKLRERPDFPDPIGELAQGAIWDLDEVAAWNGSGLRRSTSGRPSAEAAASTLGGRFLIEDKIDSGGFADVFRAVDKKKSGRIPAMAAVKVVNDLAAMEPESVERFKRELRMLDDELEHPHIIPILGHGEMADGKIWYAMPLARGSLRARLEEMVDQSARILDLMRQVCGGLQYIHDKGIYHRDLKPENILSLDAGTWAISDFGLAVQAERKSTILTPTLRPGLGSQFYVAPEQWKCARDADQRSDIYSLGKILQELATGEIPTSGVMPAIPFRPIVERATEQQPYKRYQSIRDFLTAIEHAIETPKTRWETAAEAAKRLGELIKARHPDYESLRALVLWAERLDEKDQDDMVALTMVLPLLSSWSIAALLDGDEEAFRRIYRRFADYIGRTNFAFNQCDGLATFCKRVLRESNDHALLRVSVTALAELGADHNRWYVRDVLTEILQTIRDPEPALAAVDGLREAPHVRGRMVSLRLHHQVAAPDPARRDPGHH